MNQLEKALESDYGEFDFIDEGDDSVLSTSSGKQIHQSIGGRPPVPRLSLYEEVIDELENKRDNNYRQQKYSQKKSALGGAVSPTVGGHQGLGLGGSPAHIRSSNLSLHSPSLNGGGVYGSNASPSKTRLGHVPVYADHTLMLRHHQKRKWLLQQNNQANNFQHQGAPHHIFPTGNSLRRCSSLSQTDGSTNNPFNSLATSATSVNKTGSTNQVSFPIHTRLTVGGPPKQPTTPSVVANGKCQKSPATNNRMKDSNEANNNTYNTRKSPWLLRGNLSSYARRRRGSSTSLHTTEDEAGSEMDDCQRENAVNVNGCHQSNGGNIQDSSDSSSLSLNRR